MKKFDKNIKVFEFDFNESLTSLDSNKSKSWKPLREGISESLNSYPIADSEIVDQCRSIARKDLVPFLRKSFPSLSDFDKADPADDWIPES